MQGSWQSTALEKKKIYEQKYTNISNKFDMKQVQTMCQDATFGDGVF